MPVYDCSMGNQEGGEGIMVTEEGGGAGEGECGDSVIGGVGVV